MTKAKVTIKPGKGGSGTKIASVPVTASTGKKPKAKKLYQTRAQLTTHLLKNGRKRR